MWGYIAWRLAGEAGLALVAEAEAARTNPGSELMVEVFKLAGPSVILLDELTMFARQLDDDRFEAFLSFIQSLTEAAKMVPGVLIVGSLPESACRGRRREGRGGAAAAGESVRPRAVALAAGRPATRPTRSSAAGCSSRSMPMGNVRATRRSRPSTSSTARTRPSFRPRRGSSATWTCCACPTRSIPELFDRLSKDWAGLEKFQRTRGVLRFMANVVGVLWHAQTHDPLIMPARVPVAHERVRASVLYPLDPAFGAVVDKEVDGDGSLPARMEANPSRRISQMRAATRVGAGRVPVLRAVGRPAELPA